MTLNFSWCVIMVLLVLSDDLRAEDLMRHQDLFWYADDLGARQVVTSPDDWARRREQVLAGMQAVMGPLPDRRDLPPLDVHITETAQGEGYLRHTLSLLSLFDERVTAYLYVPTDLEAGEKRPAALTLHSTGEAGKEIADGRGRHGMTRGYAAELARRGYVVIAADYPSFGEQKGYVFDGGPYLSGTMKAISDNMRCIDLLLARDDVDGDRIACIGHSLGGHNALFTAVFDERIAVVVTSCGWTPFHHYYGGKKLANWAQDRYMPRIVSEYGADPDRVPFDFAEVLGAIAPRAVFSNSPLHDENFDAEGVRLAAAEVRRVYELHGAGDRFVVAMPAYGHDFQDETRRAAYEFIDARFEYSPSQQVP
jgi:dienelactone hydrolase